MSPPFSFTRYWRNRAGGLATCVPELVTAIGAHSLQVASGSGVAPERVSNCRLVPSGSDATQRICPQCDTVFASCTADTKLPPAAGSSAYSVPTFALPANNRPVLSTASATNCARLLSESTVTLSPAPRR